MKNCILLFMVIFGIQAASAQSDSLATRYQLFGGYVLNSHTADFRALPGVPNCCPQFTDGSGNGMMSGLGIGLPLGDHLLFELRVSYLTQNALLQREEATNIINQGVSQGGSFMHEITARLASLGVEPSVSYRLFGQLFVHAGGRVGVMLSPTFDQAERIVSPSGATFSDASGGNSGMRVRNQFTNQPLPNVQSLQAALIGRISYELPLNAKRSLLLAPEVSYQYGITPLIQNLTWNMNALRMGISLTYQPQRSIEKRRLYEKKYRRDTTDRKMRIPGIRVVLLDSRQANSMVEDDSTITTTTQIIEHYERQIPLPPIVLTPSITAVGIDKNGTEKPVGELVVEEFRSEYFHPLLTYVFFDSASATLPTRYHRFSNAQEAARFDMLTLRGRKALDIYYDVLNIVGSRLTVYPAATITLTGCNSDNGVEKGNTTLSTSRMEDVQSYLEKVWNISANRIKTEVRNLPEKPSNPLTPDGMQENRRVEISSSMPEITDVVNTSDTVRVANPPTLRFKPAVISSEGLASWKVTVSQNGTVLQQHEGTTTPPAVIDWDVTKSQTNLPRYDTPVTIKIEARDKDGNTAEQTMTLPTNQRTIAKKRNDKSGDKVIENYGLILFDFGKSTLSERNLRVTNFVKKRLVPASTVTLAGYTDRTGNLQINQKLSAKRANSAAVSIGRPNAEQKGVGQTELLYDNALPEGRQYCRTVQISVETFVP